MPSTPTAHTAATGLAVSVPIRDWQVQSSAVTGGGRTVSRADYRPDGWLPAPARSTVMAALLANGQYPDVFRSTRLRDAVDAGRFGVPWWFRTLFSISAGGRTLVRLDGVIHRAELWVNGSMVAGPEEIAGAYPVRTVDVTEWVRPGVNAMALLVMPGHPMADLSIGWIDWNPAPPDANMGVWRDVWVQRTGEIRLADPYVATDLSPSLDRARLRVAVDLASAAPAARTVILHGTLCRADAGAPDDGATVRFRTEVTVPAGQTRHLVLTAAEVPELAVDDPAVWWPVGHGTQPMYQLHLVAAVDGAVSDQAEVTFGVRQVTSHIAEGGGRQFVINGRPIQVRGAGWCSDIFLRYDPQRLADQLDYVVDLGLNAVRLEGKLENREFYEIADRLGIMVLPGWECCTKWESHAGTGGASWTDQDFAIARRSMAAEARLLRNHPSVICFAIGSDFAPPCRLAEIYLAELRDADWPVPVVSSGATKWNNDGGDPAAPDTTATEGAGPSGMKMWPYDWVPPVYWYSEKFGGAVGFDSECSAGHVIPRLPSLHAMLDPGEIESLWQQPDAHHYHSSPSAPFSSLAIFHRALAGRYGAVLSLRDFLRKSQLANYEAVRAQFEAYRARATAGRPATGVIYWMLNSAWPSLNWQLFDHHLDPGGAYFGAKAANEPVHVQLGYDTDELVVTNATPVPVGPFGVHVAVRRLDGTPLAETDVAIGAVAAGGVASAGEVAIPEGVGTTYFVELELTDADGSRISRNVYWRSTRQDELDWDRSTWQYTPQSDYADLTGLQDLPSVRLSVRARTEPTAAGTWLTVVTLVNPSTAPAVGIHLSVVRAGSELPVTPIRWQHNDITLFGGQSIDVSARYSAIDLGGAPLVRVEGFNVVDGTVRPDADRTVTESAR